MDIKVGGVYRTREGKKVKITGESDDAYYGTLFSKRREGEWYCCFRDGNIHRPAPHGYDLVSEWSEPVLTKENLEDFTPSKKAKAIQVDRDQVYGDARYSFARIAKVWSGVLNHNVTPTKVARCMAGLKLVRDDLNPNHKDSLIDLINYADLTEYLKQFETNDSST